MVMNMKKDWVVTYDILSPDSSEEGDYAESGFVGDNLSLKDAIEAVGGKYVRFEPDSYPCNNGYVRWLTNHQYNENYSTGETEGRSLHIPKRITLSSRKRLLRYLEVKTG
jgi:hypothetical protein